MTVLAIQKKNVLVRYDIFQVQNLNSDLKANPNQCAILYDGINQSGEVENIPVGEFSILVRSIHSNMTMAHKICQKMIILQLLVSQIPFLAGDVSVPNLLS